MNTSSSLELTIDAAWERRDSVSPDTGGEIVTAVAETMQLLDAGAVRVANPSPDGTCGSISG